MRWEMGKVSTHLPQFTTLRVSGMQHRERESMWSPADSLSWGDGYESSGRSGWVESTGWSAEGEGYTERELQRSAQGPL